MAGRQNEVRFAVSSYRVSESDATPAVVAIVWDGIGGHRAGEEAAEMAVETISTMVAQSNIRDPPAILDHAIRVTSDAIILKGKDEPQCLGMGKPVPVPGSLAASCSSPQWGIHASH